MAIQITMEIQKFLNGIVTNGDGVNYKNFVSNSVNNDYDAWGYELPGQGFAVSCLSASN